MQEALHPRVPARAVDSGGSATTRQWRARKSETNAMMANGDICIRRNTGILPVLVDQAIPA